MYNITPAETKPGQEKGAARKTKAERESSSSPSPQRDCPDGNVTMATGRGNDKKGKQKRVCSQLKSVINRPGLE